jgi:hypothetical protein
VEEVTPGRRTSPSDLAPGRSLRSGRRWATNPHKEEAEEEEEEEEEAERRRRRLVEG